MDELLARFGSDLVGRLHGPLTFRLVLQPMMAMIYAARDGLNDASDNRPAYLWSVVMKPDERRTLLRAGWKSVARVTVLGALMDGVYQLIVFNWIYPGELLVVVFALAIVPYVLVRGPLSRIAQRLHDARVHG
jgi:hypothetical protein